MTQTLTQSRPRPTRAGSFTSDIARALAAFTADVSYAESMARAAVVIDSKRQMSQARQEQVGNG